MKAVGLFGFWVFFLCKESSSLADTGEQCWMLGCCAAGAVFLALNCRGGSASIPSSVQAWLSEDRAVYAMLVQYSCSLET